MANARRRSWRLDKAERFLAAADRALEIGDWETAISRSYYAVYHAVIALLEAKAGLQRRRWDHIQVQTDFRDHFTKRGYLFSMRDAATLGDLYEARLLADYSSESSSRREAYDLAQAARAFFGQITEVINEQA